MHETHRRATDVAAGLGVELEPALLRSMVMSALCRDEFGEAAAIKETLERFEPLLLEPVATKY